MKKRQDDIREERLRSGDIDTFPIGKQLREYSSSCNDDGEKLPAHNNLDPMPSRSAESLFKREFHFSIYSFAPRRSIIKSVMTYRY